MRRRRRRALLLAVGMGLLLVGACTQWAAHRKRRDALSRQLIVALIHRDTSQACRLVDAGADPNAPRTPVPPPSLKQWCSYLLHRASLPVPEGPTAFQIACGENFPDADYIQMQCPESPPLVQAMLRHGANLKGRDDDGYLPLHLALKLDRGRTARLLIAQGADVNAMASEGERPLLLASSADADTIRLLLEHGADVHVRDRYGTTPLLLAAAESKVSPQVMLLFLQHGADINAEDKDGKTPLILAFENALPAEIVRLLLEHHSNINAGDHDGITPLTVAARAASITAIRLLLRSGANVNGGPQTKETPLMAAVSENRPEVARLLLEHGADIRTRDRDDNTALIVAASTSRPDLIRLLLARGAAMEAKNRYGDTPLLAACRSGNSATIRLLIDRGANVNAQEPYHETALFLLVLCSMGPEDHKAADMLPYLLAHDANPHVIANGYTPLQFARYARRKDLVALLQKANAKH